MNSAALLIEENASLKKSLADNQRVLDEKNNRITLLEELIKQFQRKQFSASSEKLSVHQITLFNEAEDSEQTIADNNQSRLPPISDANDHA